ncbi:MAG: hypothetical protein JW990_00240 [Thermoleophilia bacterium]|nr:hypothetical protein [Thermoleophilia bacterium]
MSVGLCGDEPYTMACVDCEHASRCLADVFRDLRAQLEQVLVEGGLLRWPLEQVAHDPHYEFLSPDTQDLVSKRLYGVSAIAAEVERVRGLEAVWDELKVMRREYGEADDHSLTRDAIDLKHAICRVWDELELHADGFAALAALEAKGGGDE